MATSSKAEIESEKVEKAEKAKTRIRLVECGALGASSRPAGRAGTHVQWASTPTGQWVRVFSTTAIAPNRQRDKSRVENSLGLAEFGDAWTEFYSTTSGLPIGRGYDRVVYGDHGPYVEFSAHQLCWSTFPAFVDKPEMSFFDEYYTADGLTMLYAQKRTVVNKPNPPNGPWSAQNNRPEGYANYLIGKFYLACEPDVITVNRPSTKPRRKKKGKGIASEAEGECPEEVVEDATEIWSDDHVLWQPEDWHWQKEDWQSWSPEEGTWTEDWCHSVEQAWQYPPEDTAATYGPYVFAEESSSTSAAWSSIAQEKKGSPLRQERRTIHRARSQPPEAMSLMKRGGFLFLLILLIVITVAATTTKYWTHWLSITVMVGAMLVVDVMFLDDSSFVFDPFLDVQKM
eukprot:s600_g17.t4